MPLRRRRSPDGANGRDEWLAPGEQERGRPWAYEELLFGSPEERERARELGAVVEELESERAELARLHEELDTHLTRIAELDRRLRGLTGEGDNGTRGPTVRPTLPHPRGEGDAHDPVTVDRRSYLLARCEGFDVDSPAGPVGWVEGLRFVSRIDRPDMLEVRGGRLGRHLVLVPEDQVEEIRLGERRVLLRSTPTLTGDLLDDLGDRLRRAFHLDHTAP